MWANKDNKDSILEQARRRGLANPSAGMHVPDGYFADFTERMSRSLPYRPEAEDPHYKPADTRSNWWARIRPYTYLAAMFAGIWLMLQMFAMMGGQGASNKPMDSNPVLAAAFSDDDFIFDYLYDDMGTYELLSNISEDDADIQITDVFGTTAADYSGSAIYTDTVI